MKKLIIGLSISIIFTGCAVKKPQPYLLESEFDQKQAAKLLYPGKGEIKGQAFLKRNDGIVVTCAGSAVYLFPATDYASERIKVLYGSDNGGIRSFYAPNYAFSGDNGSYQLMIKTTTCDAQGNFKFDFLSDGSFYIQTVVAWGGVGSPQGGVLAKKVTVSGGTPQDAILTQ